MRQFFIIKDGISSQPEDCYGSNAFITFNNSSSLVGRQLWCLFTDFSLVGIRATASFVRGEVFRVLQILIKLAIHWTSYFFSISQNCIIYKQTIDECLNFYLPCLSPNELPSCFNFVLGCWNVIGIVPVFCHCYEFLTNLFVVSNIIKKVRISRNCNKCV